MHFLTSCTMNYSVFPLEISVADISIYAQVWRINGNAKTMVTKGDIGKFYSGDCYVVLYTYSGDKKEEFFLCCWFGKDSILVSIVMSFFFKYLYL